jgi:hypothetical protein
MYYIGGITLLASCQKEIRTELNDTGLVEVAYHPVVKGSTLNFTDNYQNDFGENFNIRAFKFYIQKIQLTKTNGEVVNVNNDYHLLDAANTASLVLRARVPAAAYRSIAFTIGVDSARNVSGAQTGALDPVNGMFWTWNTGYIMAKFEGSSSVSTQPGNRFEYHIGGFKGTENVVKRIELTFPSASLMELEKDKNAIININADANKWFNGANSLPISSNAVCMTPGTLAKAFAENYYTMFTVTGIENN